MQVTGGSDSHMHIKPSLLGVCHEDYRKRCFSRNV